MSDWFARVTIREVGALFFVIIAFVIIAGCGPDSDARSADASGSGADAVTGDGGAGREDVRDDTGGKTPVLNDDEATTVEGESIQVEVLSNDENVGGRTPAIASPPDHGTAQVVHGSSVRYNPDKGFDGNDSFRYQLEGGPSDRAASVRIAVDGDNDPPAGSDDFVTVVEGKTVRIDVLANDSDPEGDDLSNELIEPPSRGTVRADGDGFEFTAPADYNGDARLTYRVRDPDGATDDAAVEIGIYEKLDDPETAPVVDLPRQSIRADELAVIVNSRDSYSKSVAQTYTSRRNIPAENVISVELPLGEARIDPGDFESVIASVESQIGDDIQGYLLTWLEPYRVGCMSITSAFAFGGYADKHCKPNQGDCVQNAWSDYSYSETTRPWDEYGIRPAMMLALDDQGIAENVIDRGVSADHTFPGGTGYLLRTSDDARSARRFDFQSTAKLWDRAEDFDVKYLEQDKITDKSGVMFYLTGLTSVDGIESNSYRPGAVADHMTSFAGKLSKFGGQMSAVEWLRAGVTASYGTVVEPCSFEEKFPAAEPLTEYYFRGNTLLEAYWKSVQQPGEGVFIGEPLARPWGRSMIRFSDGTLEVETTMLSDSASYELVGRNEMRSSGEIALDGIEIDVPRRHTVKVDDPVYRHYTLRRAE